ncbi:MAG: cell division protein FtsW [Candidatus Melainabacteria bacterium]|nr:cell division protein FtsW [Candidatus Melainabacteria bacterium]
MRREENILKKLSTNFKQLDVFFLQLTASLIITGLIFAFSSSSYESYKISGSFWTLGLKQWFATIIGLFFLFIASKINYKMWDKLTWIFASCTLILMLITLFTSMGKTIGGSQRWINIGFIQFQPAEIAKLSIILLLSKQLVSYRWFEKQNLYYIAFSLLLTFTVFKQPDLGSTILILLVALTMFTLYEWPLWFIGIASMIGSYLCFLKIQTTQYQLDRLIYWINPYLEPLGKGYNLIQSKYAFALGKFLGVGLGNSTQKQGSLPVPHSDFIFSVIGEEIGFIGLTIVLLLFLSWIIRGFFLINNTKDRYGKILGSAIILVISFQAIMNIAVTVGLLPITGVTLPFFSCGGTSIIVTLVMCGILFNIISKQGDRS